jgi:hypothetical protein
LNNNPTGTVSHIYVTSDGGASLDTIYSLIPLLAEHVQVVGPSQLINLVYQKEHHQFAQGDERRRVASV